MIENLSEPGHIGYGLTIGASERRDRNGSGEVEVLRCRLGAQLLEEGKEILRIGARDAVTADARFVWIFPAKGNAVNEWRGNGGENFFGSLEVDCVKLVFGSHIKDSRYKLCAVRRRDRRGEISGTGPSTDGDTGHGAMCLSLGNEFGDVADPRVVKAED